MPVVTAVTEFCITTIIIIIILVVVVVVVVVIDFSDKLICNRSSKIKYSKLLRYLSNNWTF